MLYDVGLHLGPELLDLTGIGRSSGGWRNAYKAIKILYTFPSTYILTRVLK